MAMCSVEWFARKPVGDDHIHGSGGSALKIGDLSECTNLNFLLNIHAGKRCDTMLKSMTYTQSSSIVCAGQ